MKKIKNPVSKIADTTDIVDVSMSAIIPAEYNPREISNEALLGLKRSLEKFGIVDLMVINRRNMRIISGHQRYKVLKEAGLKRVKVVMVDLDEVNEMALNVALNSQAIQGEWTKAIIPILERFRIEMPSDYIALRMNQLRDELSHLEIENTGQGKTLPDDIPAPPKSTITKKGDLWILGSHRLLCGDSTNEDDVKRLMKSEKATLFATDPPYCVDYRGCDRPRGGKDWSGVYHEIDIPDARNFLKQFLQIGLKYIKEKTAMYLWHASKRRATVESICDELGILIHQQIIWVKPVGILTYSFYMWRHEPCLLMWKKTKKPPYKPKDKSVGSVWTPMFVRTGDPSDPKYHSDVWEVDWEGKKRNPGYEHPTVKPTEVFAIPMRVHTSVNDVCYEPFSGSGSQIIAGERLNRRVFAMEIEPVFCDVAVKRWEEFTGKKAHLEAKS